MPTSRFAIIFAAALAFCFQTAYCGHPAEMLADVVGGSPIIVVGKIASARKTDKFASQKGVNYYYYVFTIKIDTVLKGDAHLRQFDVMDFPGTAGCMDTSRNVKCLFFLSKSPFVAKDVTDWMVERQYKIVKGSITPTEFIDEKAAQPLRTFEKKIGEIVALERAKHAPAAAQ
jgi:hypothetical protein